MVLNCSSHRDGSVTSVTTSGLPIGSVKCVLSRLGAFSLARSKFRQHESLVFFFFLLLSVLVSGLSMHFDAFRCYSMLFDGVPTRKTLFGLRVTYVRDRSLLIIYSSVISKEFSQTWLLLHFRAYHPCDTNYRGISRADSDSCINLFYAASR